MSKQGFIKNPFNYTGGKFDLLPQLNLRNVGYIDNFYDIFVGGSDVTLNTMADNYYANDKSFQVYTMHDVFSKNSLEHSLGVIDGLISEFKLSADNQDAFKYFSTTFFSMQELGSDMYAYCLYLCICHSFANQLSVSDDGRLFTGGWGKRTFNATMRKNLEQYIEYIQAYNVQFTNKSFEQVDLRYTTPNSLVYCDPPYLITDAVYNKGWSRNDEVRLLTWLNNLNGNDVRFALSNVLYAKGQRNDILLDWIDQNDYIVNILDKNYKHAITGNRSDLSHILHGNGEGDCEVLICNYEIE